MIRIAKWPGWVSSASPYILPAGGSVEQINAQSLVPGQLSVRGGMAPVTPGTAARTTTGRAVLEMWGYSTGSNSTELIFAFTDDGQITQIANPKIEYKDPTPGVT